MYCFKNSHIHIVPNLIMDFEHQISLIVQQFDKSTSILMRPITDYKI